MVLGTPKYISPEQCDGREHLSGKSDVYSLGIILYEMLAGAAPFHAKSAMAFMRQHMVGTPPPLRERAPQVPKALHDLVHTMLAKEPPQRPEMAQVAEQLRQMLAANQAGSTLLVVNPVRPPRPIFWLIGAALAVVGLLGVGFFTVVRPRWQTLTTAVTGTQAVTPTPLPTPAADLAVPTPMPLKPEPKVALPVVPPDAGSVEDAGAPDLLDAAAPEPLDLEPPPTDVPEPPPTEVHPPVETKVKPVVKHPVKPVVKNPVKPVVKHPVKPVGKHPPAVKSGKHPKGKPPVKRPDPRHRGGKRGKHARSHGSTQLL